MNPVRLVFPGFWFGKSDLAQARELARRGVGGFCVYGGTAEQTLDFTRQMNEASAYDKLLFCADINDNLAEVITDAPSLPSNAQIASSGASQDVAYRKGNFLGRMARAVGVDWLLAPVVDLGYTAPAFSDDPLTVARLAGDMLAGLSNAGALNCIKYFPGVSGALKTLPQLEDAEFVPYKHLFRRADALMPSDMVFPGMDETPAMLSDKVLKGLLKKRLNYKGCVVSFPLWRARLRYEGASAVKMLYAGVENILAPKDALGVIEALEREINHKGFLIDEAIQALSNQEMFISKVSAGSAPESIKEIFTAAQQAFK